jgi:hypothetical protein
MQGVQDRQDVRFLEIIEAKIEKIWAGTSLHAPEGQGERSLEGVHILELSGGIDSQAEEDQQRQTNVHSPAYDLSALANEHWLPRRKCNKLLKVVRKST